MTDNSLKNNRGEWKEFNAWRDCIQSDNGPDDPNLCYVLLTLSTFMNPQLYCWPSIQRIAERTRLSEKTVRTKLKLARDLGWVRVTKHSNRGKNWALNGYHGTFPEHLQPNLESLMSDAR